MKFTKLIRNKKAISPIFATLILIAIAVIAGIVVYMFTSGTIAGLTGGGTAAQEKVAVQAVQYDAGPPVILTVYAKSTGGTDVQIDGAIVKDSGGSTIEVSSTIGGTAAGLLDETGTLTAVDVTLTTGLGTGSYTVTLTSVGGGSFVSAAFMP